LGRCNSNSRCIVGEFINTPRGPDFDEGSVDFRILPVPMDTAMNLQIRYWDKFLKKKTYLMMVIQRMDNWMTSLQVLRWTTNFDDTYGYRYILR